MDVHHFRAAIGVRRPALRSNPSDSQAFRGSWVHRRHHVESRSSLLGILRRYRNHCESNHCEKLVKTGKGTTTSIICDL